jgi:hypothetical protein
MLTQQVRMNDIAINETSLTNIADDTRILTRVGNGLHCRLVGHFAAG